MLRRANEIDSCPLLACALLAACTASAGSGSHLLAGSHWQFTEIDEAVPASRNARLALEPDRLGANVGCNGMGGPWRIEDERLIAGPLVKTQMYCHGSVMEQERAVSALLVGAPRIEVRDGKLAINSSGHSAELKRVEAD